MVYVTPDERWLTAVWPLVRAALPTSPAKVVEIGCGRLGGFVPMMRSTGYEAIGVDPEAPSGPWYFQDDFERYQPLRSVDAIVACTSLHHVGDLAELLDLAAAALLPTGLIVVVEWARERFDEQTARWCFDRLPEPGGDPGYLHELREQWCDSGRSWRECLESWADSEGMHTGEDILRALASRFDSGPVNYGPYFFCDLADTSEADELAAIDSGLIKATRILYAGRSRDQPPD
jgi:SAM-dependent methyltransferase